MTRGAVPLVRCEPVPRVPRVEVHHNPIARDLCEDTRGGDGCDHRVTPEAGDVLSIQGTSGSAAAAFILTTTIYAHPLWLAAGAIDRLGVYHTVNGAGTSWRVTLFPSSALTGKPVGEAPLLDGGVLDMSTGAVAFNWNPVTYTIPRDGIYWAAVQGVTASSAPSAHRIAFNSTNAQPLLHGVPVNAFSVGRQQLGLMAPVASTAAPGAFPTANWDDTVVRCFVRYA